MYSARNATIHHRSRGHVENPNIPRPSCKILQLFLARQRNPHINNPLQHWENNNYPPQKKTVAPFKG